jgi:hypothetical protein
VKDDGSVPGRIETQLRGDQEAQPAPGSAAGLPG